MPKFKTERFIMDGSVKGELNFKYDIYIDKDGVFSTTLPQDIVALFEKAQIRMHINKMKNRGYVTSSTYDGLVKSIKNICEEYLSRELINEKIVLKYQVETSCSYMLNEDSEIVPNGFWARNGKWKGGTMSTHAASPETYGIWVYVKPMVRKDYKYKSGTQKTEYIHISHAGEKFDDLKKEMYNLRWLDDLTAIKSRFHGQVKEIDYSESVAEFFVGMIKFICNLNEKIKDFLEPEMIQMIVDKKMNLLTEGK
jgi:hypothetical protein